MKAAELISLLLIIMATIASTTTTTTHNLLSGVRWSAELEKELSNPPTLSELAELPICNQAAPPERLSPGSSVGTDTIGQLVSSQFMWRLPGLDHAMHGFDVLTGGEKTKPIFLFCYPKENARARRLEDAYRGNSYMLPDGVFANAAPRCAYSMDSQSYTSSQEMAQSMMDSSDLSASAGGGGGGFGFSFSARAAYSQHSSVSSAMTAQSNKGGSVQMTKVQCITSRVKLADDIASWHPSFVQAMLGVKDQTDLFRVMLEYGTHFYSSFELGGQLSQVSSTTTEHAATSSESDTQTNAEASFSASASGWGMSGEASGSYATSHGMQTSNQAEYEKQTSKSDILTLGGALGSFGPAGPGAADSPTNWGAWAQTVDMLPVPLNYKLRCLYEIIPDTWTNQNGSKTIKDLWKAAAGQFSRHVELEAMKAMLGGKNVYTISIETGASTPSGGAGPYLFSLAGIDPRVTMPNIFFTEQMSLGANKKAPPYTITHPHRFWPNSKFVFEHVMPDLDELKTITLCDTSAITPPITMATRLQNWGLQSLHVEDKYRGLVHYFQPTSFTTTTDPCQTFSPIKKNPGITILYTIGTSNDPNDESPGLVVEFTFEGTSTYKKYYLTSGDAMPLKKGQRMSFNFPFSKTDKDLGSIMSVKMELQAPYYWYAGENTPLKFQRGIESMFFRVYYTYGDQTEAYEIASSPSLLKSISPGIPAVFYLQLV